jgi:hypothetical protein
MTERRYSDEEAAEIFERAAAEEARGSAPAAPRPDGRSLEELQAIGAEAGIPPDLVARAARSIDHADTPVRQTFLGFPLAVGRTVQLGRTLTDAEWARLVGDLRTTFDATGRVRVDGPFRQWSNGNLRATLEPTEAGDRLRIRTMKGDARGMIQGGLALLGIAVVLLVLFVVGGEPMSDWAPMLILSLLGGGMVGIGALQLPGWASTRLEQMEAIVDRLMVPGPGEDRATGTGSLESGS